MGNKHSVILIILFFSCVNVISQEPPFLWNNDTLVVNDGLSEQEFLYNNGLLTYITTTSLAKQSAAVYSMAQPDRSMDNSPIEIDWNIAVCEETERTAGYSQLDLHSVYDDFELIRRLRKYNEVPGIEWSLLIKGDTENFDASGINGTGLIEDPNLLTDNQPHYFYMPFSTPHFATTIVSFRESTDHHTNVVQRQETLPYRRSQYYRGAMVISKNNSSGEAHLVVKKSPLGEAQSDYAGFDFSTDFTGLKIHSPGFGPATKGDKNEWREAYSVFVIMHAANENAALDAYKQHELAIHRFLPQRDNTFTMNTWGDRSRDSRVNEAFILQELAIAARLGITNYQIDDGWQQGLSANSAERAGLLWADWGVRDWEVNSERFPNGLTAVKHVADSLSIDLGLWFNPSNGGNYAMWKRDQQIMLDLHKRYGISWIKIDGLEIDNKLSEKRIGEMLGGAIDKSNGKLQFNIDVTAGKRGGYFYFNHFGNIFLENRYTDWGNYYPHLTLRNVWQLAKYMPIQRFQIEWLNKWRNDGQYPEDDPLKPMNVPFDYQFAITMMGQPLAWMEASGLPEEAFDAVALIEQWKTVRDDMQAGLISSIGDEPNGYGFPGFVSKGKEKTFILLFRENSVSSIGVYNLHVQGIAGKQFVPVVGEVSLLEVGTNYIKAEFKEPFQFLLGYFE